MKRALTIAALIAAFPLLAAGEEPSKPKQPATEAEAAENSPLVAAAKRSNRLGKKPQKVISNETLAASGGKARITTTASQPPIELPKGAPTPSAESILKRQAEERRRREAEAASHAKAAAEAAQRRRAAAAAVEEGMYDQTDVDPAQAERKLQEEAARTQQKPPGR